MDRLRGFPKTEDGRRNLAAFVRLFGITDECMRTNWDLSPIRWTQELEIRNAALVAENREIA